MSETREELYDLAKETTEIPIDSIYALQEAIKKSLIDYNYEICYMDGVTVKTKNLFSFDKIASDVYTKIRKHHISQMTCSLKKPTTN